MHLNYYSTNKTIDTVNIWIFVSQTDSFWFQPVLSFANLFLVEPGVFLTDGKWNSRRHDQWSNGNRQEMKKLQCCTAFCFFFNNMFLINYIWLYANCLFCHVIVMIVSFTFIYIHKKKILPFFLLTFKMKCIGAIACLICLLNMKYWNNQ